MDMKIKVNIEFNISESSLEDAFEEYDELWVEVSPDIVVINLSYNDSSSEVLATALQSFTARNEREGIRTMFVIEPAAPGKEGSSRLKQNRDAMRAVATEHEVEVVGQKAVGVQVDVRPVVLRATQNPGNDAIDSGFG